MLLRWYLGEQLNSYAINSSLPILLPGTSKFPADNCVSVLLDPLGSSFNGCSETRCFS